MNKNMRKIKEAWNIQKIGQPNENERMVYNEARRLNREVQMLESALTYNPYEFSLTMPQLTANATQPERNRMFQGIDKECMKRLYTNPVTKYFREYCEHSTLHGLRYLGEKKMSIFERLCWLCFLGMSLVACVYLIRKTWIKWERSPVLVTFSGDTISVSDVPFPAVTVCSELKVDNTKFNLTEMRQRYLRMSPEEVQNIRSSSEFKKLSTLSLICGSYTTDGDEEIDEQTVQFLAEIGIPCYQLMILCKWQGDTICGEVVFPILTEEGMCCTFNMVRPKDMFTNTTIIYNTDLDEQWKRVQNWTLEDGYAKTLSFRDKSQTYPHRSFGSGLLSGLGLLIADNTQIMDTTCSMPEMGFKMLLHNPAEFPSMSGKFLKLPENKQMVVAVKPSVFTTMDNLRGYSPEKRGCFFPEEKKLRYFKIYTQENCEFECKVNLTLTFCGCVSFYMPRDENTVYCGPGRLECVQGISAVAQVRRLFQNTEKESEISEQQREILAKINKCSVCLPACTEIQYDAQTSHSDFDFTPFSELGIESYSITTLSVFFKDLQFITTHRSELYGWTDFLANCGGIMGFCLGFSVLSLIEIIYFLTVRLAFKVYPKLNSTKVLPT